MSKYLLLGMTILLTLVACENEPKTGGYILNGEIEKAKDSTMIYMFSDIEPIDSTLIIDGKFQFTGKVEEPKNVYLNIKESRDHASIWLENGTITFKAKRKHFLDRIIKGSNAQESANLLHSQTLDLQKEIDALYLISMDPNTKPEDRDASVDKYSKLFDQLDLKNRQFAKGNPNSFETLKLLYLYNKHWGKEEVAAIFAKTNSEMKSSSLGKSIDQYLKLPSKPNIGERYIDFSLKNTMDQETRLSDLESGFTLVEFWASWCGPCRKENPGLLKLYDQYKDQGFTIVGVSLDQNNNNWLNAIKDDQLSWDNLIDVKAFDGEVASIYEVNSIPQNFIIDKEGNILANNVRGEKLEEFLENLFK